MKQDVINNQMDIHPLISVVMSVYNEPIDWVRQSIDSILNQTFSDFEFIIVNDNPISVEHKDLLHDYANHDSRIKLIENTDNKGLTKSLNIGIAKASGKYIARMDADDISMPSRFYKQFKYMETHPNVIVLGTPVIIFGNNVKSYYNTYFKNDIDIRGQMLFNSGFAHPSVIIRKSALDDNNIKYDENFQTAQDYKLWYDLSGLGQFANLSDKLLKYRFSNNQITSKKKYTQQNNRLIIQELFRNKLYNSIGVSMNGNKSKELYLVSKYNKREKKILESYQQRAVFYETQSILKYLQFLFTNKTACTTKELIVFPIHWLKNKLNNI